MDTTSDLGPQTSDGAAHLARVRRTRTIAKLWATARQAGFDKPRVYAIGTEALGRLLQEDFGITTCTDDEVTRFAAAVAHAAGQPWNDSGRRPGRRSGRRHAPAALRRPDGQLRPSLAAMQFLRTLVEELRWDGDECAGHFARACGKAVPQSAGDFARCIEMCKAVKRRRQLAAAAREGQLASPGGDVA